MHCLNNNLGRSAIPANRREVGPSRYCSIWLDFFPVASTKRNSAVPSEFVPKTIRVCLLVLAAGLLVVCVDAQTRNRRDIEAIIESRLKSQEPISVSAETITVTGDVLSLKGKVALRFGGDTIVRADEAEVNPTTHAVQLLGNVRATLGRSARPAPEIPPVMFR